MTIISTSLSSLQRAGDGVRPVRTLMETGI